MHLYIILFYSLGQLLAIQTHSKVLQLPFSDEAMSSSITVLLPIIYTSKVISLQTDFKYSWKSKNNLHQPSKVKPNRNDSDTFFLLHSFNSRLFHFRGNSLYGVILISHQQSQMCWRLLFMGSFLSADNYNKCNFVWWLSFWVLHLQAQR
jgi:hypothetical protein